MDILHDKCFLVNNFVDFPDVVQIKIARFCSVVGGIWNKQQFLLGFSGFIQISLITVLRPTMPNYTGQCKRFGISLIYQCDVVSLDWILNKALKLS